MKPIILLTLILLSSCSSLQESYDSHSYTEKVLLGTMVTCQAADYVTTKNAMDKGYEELNPIYNNNPDLVLLGKVILTGGTYLFAQAFPEQRKLAYGIMAGFGCGAAAWNMRF